jgi:hypothetical protein
MRAASKGHREVTQVLLGAKANTFLRNRDGLTAAEIARKCKFGDGEAYC